MKDRVEKYVRILAPLDAIHCVGQASPTALFFQFARQDEFISEHAAGEDYRAASEPKRMSWWWTHI